MGAWVGGGWVEGGGRERGEGLASTRSPAGRHPRRTWVVWVRLGGGGWMGARQQSG